MARAFVQTAKTYTSLPWCSVVGSMEAEAYYIDSDMEIEVVERNMVTKMVENKIVVVMVVMVEDKIVVVMVENNIVVEKRFVSAALDSATLDSGETIDHDFFARNHFSCFSLDPFDMFFRNFLKSIENRWWV